MQDALRIVVVAADLTIADPGDDYAISAALEHTSGPAARRLASLQGVLQCGTHRGSCIPELQRLVRAATPVSSAAA